MVHGPALKIQIARVGYRLDFVSVHFPTGGPGLRELPELAFLSMLGNRTVPLFAKR